MKRASSKPLSIEARAKENKQIPYPNIVLSSKNTQSQQFFPLKKSRNESIKVACLHT
jgi:hypothetical protein